MRNTLLLLLFFPLIIFGQGYTSYFTGNTTNITTTTEFGVCLMGGASEHDDAMRWLLEKANGGDVVVLRSSGSNGYNDYLYSELGIAVNSVETLVITSFAGAIHPYVLDKVANAEMIWFAGGDQWNYVSFFRGNSLEDLINEHINVKNAPIGGTSAGMAILGEYYFSAANGSVTSSQVLNNPFHTNIVLGSDFIEVPYLENVITDSHYDNPDRRGRHSGFLARLKNDFLTEAKGIACNEYVAVCIDQDGKARVFGEYPDYEEFAYFVQPNCNSQNLIEVISENTPLTWNFSGEALKVYKVPGLMTGDYWFDLSDWQSGEGGSWEHWSVNNGIFSAVNGSAQDCSLNTDVHTPDGVSVYPNPFKDSFIVQFTEPTEISIFDIRGKKIYNAIFEQETEISTADFTPAIYILKAENSKGTSIQKIVKN